MGQYFIKYKRYTIKQIVSVILMFGLSFSSAQATSERRNVQTQLPIDLESYGFARLDIPYSKLSIAIHHSLAKGICGIALRVVEGFYVTESNNIMKNLVIEDFGRALKQISSKQGFLSFEWPWARKEDRYVDIVSLSTKDPKITLQTMFRKHLASQSIRERTLRNSSQEFMVIATPLLCEESKDSAQKTVK